MSLKHDQWALPPLESTFSTTPSLDASRRKSQDRHNFLRKELTIFLGEFVGTLMFLSGAFAGTQIANESPARLNLLLPVDATTSKQPDPSKLIYIAFSFGASLAANAAIFSDISGAMFNPAVRLQITIYPFFHLPIYLFDCSMTPILGSDSAFGSRPDPLAQGYSLNLRTSSSWYHRRRPHTRFIAW